ncbi:MAG TPA: glycosyltransferase [Thermoplasmata archaeon]|nr:glycosyltransferase [Thermoplasmata archaeon]
MPISVVIPYYRAADTIEAQLAALAEQRCPEPWEVVIADNESSDELRRIIPRHEPSLPSLRVVDASARRGEGHARNVGVRAARSDLIAFCDADDVVGAGWLSAMHQALAVHDFVACRLDFERLNPSWARRIFADHPQQRRLMQTRYAPYFLHAGGGTLGFRRHVFETAGGFDETWPVLTDKEFCLRAHLAGNLLHFVPDAVVHYRCRSTTPRLFKRSITFGFYDARLYRRYREPKVGDPRLWTRYFQKWLHLMHDVPELTAGATRASWIWKSGWQIGQLVGSIRYLVPAM